MSNFKRVLAILKEETTENVSIDEVYSKIEEVIKKYFPDGFIKKSLSNLGPRKSLSITFASTKEDGWKNKIIQNDYGMTIFWIHDAWDKKDDSQVNTLVMEKPSGSGRAGRGIRWTKAKGLPAILKQVDKYMAALKENLKNFKG